MTTSCVELTCLRCGAAGEPIERRGGCRLPVNWEHHSGVCPADNPWSASRHDARAVCGRCVLALLDQLLDALRGNR